jgi:hypothetical protein
VSASSYRAGVDSSRLTASAKDSPTGSETAAANWRFEGVRAALDADIGPRGRSGPSGSGVAPGGRRPPGEQSGRRGVRTERDAERCRGAGLARERELLAGERRRLVRAAERVVRRCRGGAPGCDRGVVDAKGLPARAGLEQVAERVGGTILRDPQRAARLQERERVDPAGGRLPFACRGGDGIRLVQAPEAGERVDAQGGGPGDGERRGGRELELQRQPAIGGGVFELPKPPHD